MECSGSDRRPALRSSNIRRALLNDLLRGYPNGLFLQVLHQDALSHHWHVELFEGSPGLQSSVEFIREIDSDHFHLDKVTMIPLWLIVNMFDQCGIN